MPVRHLTFGTRTSANTNPQKLRDELGQLPELSPYRDKNGNLQTSFITRFDDAGVLTIDLPADKPTEGVVSVVDAHDPAPPDDVQRGERMREKVNHYIDIATDMATKIRAGDATPAEQRFALAAVLDATARLARLQLRELDAES